jgi:Leucine-rich repeat (LRR) protein
MSELKIISLLDSLKYKLNVLKQVTNNPRSHLESYFSDLKNEVTTSFYVKLDQQQMRHTDYSDTKLKLNLNEMLHKINEYESECISKSTLIILENEDNNDLINSIELKLLMNTDLLNLNDLLYDEIYKLEKILFLNKTLFFIDKIKYENETNNSQQQSNSDDSNESFTETINLFHYMNNKNTFGKLVLIQNEYFGKRTIPFLKYGEEVVVASVENDTESINQERLTCELIKSYELRKQMEKLLTKNQIDEIIVDCLNLDKIDFAFFELKQIEENVFKSNFLKLKYINLSDNYLHKLPNNLFKTLFDLRSISLASNRLTSIDSNTFESNHLLTEINLADNLLTEISDLTFHGLDRLELIYLNKNKLTKITHKQFHDLTSLKWLYLDKNQIETVESTSFTGLNQLIEINLSENKIDSIEVNTFVGLVNLEDLNFRFNKIKYLPHDLFNDLCKLTSLDMSNNELVEIHADQFIGLHELTFINLSSNKIEFFDEKIVQSLVKLKLIDLSYNLMVFNNDCNKMFSKLPIRY